jgi:hypothetical protein
MAKTMIYRLTVDLARPGDPVPTTRYQFFGATEDECEDQLIMQCQQDRILRHLVRGHDEYEGFVMHNAMARVPLEKVQKGMMGYEPPRAV